MSDYHAPKEPPEWVLNFIHDRWIINPEEGIVLSRLRGTSIGSEGGDGYIWITILTYRRIKRSHVIWFGYHGEWPTQQFDHDNRNRLDDKIGNLIPTTAQGNSRNKEATLRRTLPIGVYKPGNGYQVIQRVENKPVYKGWFPLLEDAIQCNGDFDKKKWIEGPKNEV